ncbi:hypothetical protein GYB73_00925 [Sinorhizobium meliloti]|nr:hypothetical protein [Sinorhizobium meliloti]
MDNQRPKLYSADRRGLYRNGPLTLMLSPPVTGIGFLNSHRGDFTADDIYQHVLNLFPEGLSIHGWDFATVRNWRQISETETTLEHNPAIELAFEYVRRSNFPEKPSRLQSYFAFDDADRVRAFSDAPIFEVKPANAFKFDMTWLNVSNQLAIASYNAHQYWGGAASATPDWEYLLVPPVEISRL